MDEDALALQLHRATTMGDTVVVAQSLTNGANVDAIDDHGETALMRAAARGDLATVDVLLAAQAAVDTLGLGEWIALGYAVRRGHAAVVQSLVAAGANVDCVNGQGDSALLCAIWSNHADVVDVLLAHTATVKVNIVNKASESALILACSSHYDPVLIERLVQSGADVNVAIQHAVKTNDTAMLKRLLPWVKDMKHSTFGPLEFASEKGHIETVRILLQAGADVHAASALRTASAMGHSEIVEVFLAVDGIDVDYQQNNDSDPALMHAAWFGHADIVEKLVAVGANMHHENRYYRTALMQTIVQEKLEVVETLLDRGVAVDQVCDPRRGAALAYASLASNAAILEALLARGGANVNDRNAYGMSALHTMDFDLRRRNYFARNYNRGRDWGAPPAPYPEGLLASVKTRVDILLAHGADIDHASMDGTTPLMKACDLSGVELVACLLAAGADASLTDNDGDSALLRAAKAGNVAIVEMLLASGVDVNHVNNDRRSALLVAASYGHVAVVDALLRAGANAAIVDARSHSAVAAVQAGLSRLCSPENDTEHEP